VAEYGELLDTWALVTQRRQEPSSALALDAAGGQMDVDASFVPLDVLALTAAGRG
jgi:hypothetical protein